MTKIELKDLSDEKFLDLFFDDELSDDLLEELDNRLSNTEFKKYYQDRLKEKHNLPLKKVAIDYLPMFLFLALIIIGIYLITQRI